jgi:hypothetical protein
MSLIVSLIMDPDFAPHLKGTLADSTVWVCSSQPNQTEAKKLWEDLKRAGDMRKDPLTVFNCDPEDDPVETILDVLPAIEDHHPWTRLNVYGADYDQDLEAVLVSEYRARQVKETPFGFTVER